MLIIFILLWKYLKIKIYGMHILNWMIYMESDITFVCISNVC